MDWLSIWQGRDWRARALWPVSLVYRLLLASRRLLYAVGWWRSTPLPVPVLVVGNVVVGGAGKTPTVIGLVQHLRTQGWRPGVVSRGHGRSNTGCIEVSAQDTGSAVGDEPALIARATGVPLVVGRDRVQAGRQLLAQHPEVNLIISDDGMQHWALARDLTVVVFDDRGVGNGWLLPAGLLREPWPTRPWGKGQLLVLRTTQSLVPVRPVAGPHATFTARRQLSTVAVNGTGQTHKLTDLATQGPLAALAGIAQPQRFFDMLQARGLRLLETAALPDHADAPRLLAALRTGLTWLCTEKDAVKLFPLLPPEWAPQVWSVALEQTPEPAFYPAVDAALKPLSSAHGRQTP